MGTHDCTDSSERTRPFGLILYNSTQHWFDRPSCQQGHYPDLRLLLVLRQDAQASSTPTRPSWPAASSTSSRKPTRTCRTSSTRSPATRADAVAAAVVATAVAVAVATVAAVTKATRRRRHTCGRTK